jgi:hypothetical protein
LHRLDAVGPEIGRAALLQQELPEGSGLFCRGVELVAELAGVPGAGDQNLDLPDAARGEAEEAQSVQVHALDDGL